MMTTTMIEGSCLCGAVRYTVRSDARPMGHCHCETCRKAHGSAFSTVMPVPKEAFTWSAGEAYLRSYESSPGKTRRFCGLCGSQLAAERADQEVILLRAGCIDTELDTRPQVHIWRSDAANWYDPKDELPELPEGI